VSATVHAPACCIYAAGKVHIYLSVVTNQMFWLGLGSIYLFCVVYISLDLEIFSY